MIRFAEFDEIDKLKPLWKECFDIEFFSPYWCFYITNIFYKYKTLVYIKNNKFVSMLTLLPVFILQGEEKLLGFYIFALGTLKEYRKQGIAEEMLNFVKKYSQKLNVKFNILMPAEKNGEYLYKYYFDRGFKIIVKHKILLLDRFQMDSMLFNKDDKILKYTVEKECIDLLERRRENYKDINFIEWGIEEIKLVQKEYSLPGGEHKFFNFGQKQYAILDFRDKKKLKIREFYILKENFASFIITLLKKYPDFNLFEFYLNQNFNNFNLFYNLKPTLINVALIKPLSCFNFFFNIKNQFYFNFGLDT